MFKLKYIMVDNFPAIFGENFVLFIEEFGCRKIN